MNSCLRDYHRRALDMLASDLSRPYSAVAESMRLLSRQERRQASRFGVLRMSARLRRMSPRRRKIALQRMHGGRVKSIHFGRFGKEVISSCAVVFKQIAVHGRE